jgi:hypothetical protein
MNTLNYFIPLLLSSLWMRFGYLLRQPADLWNHAYEPLLRGVASDIAITFLLALACVAISRVRFAPIVLCLLYCFMLAANVEFIIANDANLDFLMLNQALDAAFINGAVLTSSMALRVTESIGIFALVFWLLRFVHTLRLRKIFITAIAAASLIFLLVSPLFEESPTWVQMNPLEDNASNVRYAMLQNNAAPLHFSASYVDRFFAKELDRDKIIDFPLERKPNVLLIALESVGQAHMNGGNMPFLKHLSETYLNYPNYVVESQVTVNGLYSLLCADKPGFIHPTVGSVKAWTMKDKNIKRFCLPQLLKTYGYETIYMQSAPLKFQRKNIIMPMLGFEHVLGKEQHNPNDTSAWGGDDKILYTHALNKIDTLQSEKKPWFMTIMTISTHYPAVVPDDFYIVKEGKKIAPTHLYADFSLEYFFEQLEKRGVLENTLVVVTNDEVRIGGKGVSAEINRNNGVLVVRTPDKDNATIRDIFTQADMFLSLADYLGLNTEEIPMGRSIFRLYDRFRPIFFEHYFSKKFYVYPNPNQILVCKGKPPECHTYNEENGTLFGGTWLKTKPLKQWQALIQNISKRNDTMRPKEWEKTNAAKTEQPIDTE